MYEYTQKYDDLMSDQTYTDVKRANVFINYVCYVQLVIGKLSRKMIFGPCPRARNRNKRRIFF